MSLKNFLNELMKQEDEDYKENIQSAAGKNPPYSPPEQAETVLIEPSVEFTDDELFVRSGTESSKYPIWMQAFKDAKASKKSNPVADNMRQGRFTITPDNKVLILRDYDPDKDSVKGCL